jgi:hypothetical protein
MLSFNPKSKPLSEAGLRQVVRRALEKGFIRESMHSCVDRAYRSISDDDVRFGLERRGWKLAKPPNFDEEHRNPEYLIKTVDIEGDELHLKIAVYPAENRIWIITKY